MAAVENYGAHWNVFWRIDDIRGTNQRVFFAFPVRVCIGTQNVLSTTGNSELQYNKMKKMYTGCEIVMGNLEITMMEHTRDFSFLQVRF